MYSFSKMKASDVVTLMYQQIVCQLIT